MTVDTTSRSTSRAGARDFPETILVGRVLRPHGIRGSLKIEVHSDVPERFEPGSELLMTLPGAETQTVRVRQCRPVRGGLVVDFDGVADREQAERCRGAELEIERDRVPPSPAGLYYFFELIGCRCSDEESGELGEVVDLIEDGGGFLLEIEHDGKKLLVPFVEAFVVEVDIERGRIGLRLPPGLIETCVSGS